jgi:putative tricarboxylic transport membrane protein
MTRDFFGGLAILAFAGLYYAGSLDIQRSTLADTLGAQGMPTVYAVVLAFLAAILAIRGGIGWLATRSAVAAEGKSRDGRGSVRHKIARMAGMLAIGAAYLLVIGWAGYAIAVALLIGAAALYLGAAPSRGLVLTAVIGAAVFWALFVWLLQVPLPAGLWSNLV